jgi:uncharacterized membrane protein
VTVVAATLYDWLMFLHVFAAMIWVGGTVALGALATHIVRSGDHTAVQRFVGSLRVIGPLVLAPATVAVVGFGVWMVLDNEAWGFDQTWIWVALALFAAAFAVGAAFQSRSAIGAQRAAAAGDSGEAARQLNRWAWGSRLILLMLVIATWDMVFKPGL